MCGIAGIFAFGSKDELQAATWLMVQAQSHRGPDDEGVTALELGNSGCHVTLGCSRLAVIDLSSHGHQPMQNDAGNVWIAYNGEIYNFEELRRPLEIKGYRFRSRTDTEVILNLYQEYGEGAIGMLNGMFAVAIWDQRKGTLLMARDRMGEKPLYFTWADERLIFASEIKALLASGLVQRRVDPAAVRGFLTLGSVPSPTTIIQDVECLEAGCLMKVKINNSGGHPVTQTRPERYWDLTFNEDPQLGGPEAAGVFRDHLRRATQSRLVSDVPVGVFLSGGLDSSAIVSQVRENVTGKLRSFSLTFSDPQFDEGQYARLVAHRFETDHTERMMTADEVLGEIPRFLAAIDQPTIDGVNTYFVSKLARSSGVVVALSGLGGDELLGGYSSFGMVPKICKLGRLLDRFYGARQTVSGILGWLSLNGRAEKLQAFLREKPSSESAYLAVKGQFVDGSIEKVLSPLTYQGSSTWDPLAYIGRVAGNDTESLGNRISRLEMGTYLQNQLLRDSDVMSMANSLEVRAPFLDNDLVQFVTRVPSQRKFDRPPKSLIIDAMKGVLPDEIIHRSKRGFSFPIDAWLKTEWKRFAEEVLFGGDQSGTQLFDQRGLRELWQSFLDNRIRWSRVWAVMILKLWVSVNIDGSAALRPWRP